MTGLDARLTKLREIYRRPEGCSTCRTWGPCRYVINDGDPSRPERCPDCSRLVPVQLTRHYLIRQSPMEPLPPGEDPADSVFV